VLFLNDGVIRPVDIHKAGMYVDVYSMWLENAILQFNILNCKDKKNSNPGLRGVITYGQRIQYTNELVRLGEVVKSNNSKTQQEIVVYSPNEFQMNTAFSKAYIIESSGKKAEVEGANLYIDKCFLDMFANLINDSPVQEMIKLNGNYKESVPVNNQATKKYLKFIPNLKQDKDKYIFSIEILIPNAENIEYKKVEFDKNIVPYVNERCNLNTNLYRVTGLWSYERGKLI
jgi:hypothetical protein